MANARNNSSTTSPVEPIQSSTSAPDNTSENKDQLAENKNQLAEMLKRLEKAEARAEAAEQAATEAQAKVVEAEDKAAQAEAAQKAAEAASATTVATAEIAGPTAPQDQLYDKDGHELCWNCVNHGKAKKLDAQGNCENCGFQKDKMYNGNTEAQKANERMLAGQQL